MALLLLCMLAPSAQAIAGLDPPTNVDPPFITGTRQVGQTLTRVPGAWNGTAPITYTYQWNRNGVAIGGATGTSYAVPASDAGPSITCTEKASNLLVVITAYHRGKAPQKITDPGGSWATKLGAGDHTLKSHQSIKYTRLGKYVIIARATDAAGNRSLLATATFRVTKPRRPPDGLRCQLPGMQRMSAYGHWPAGGR